MPSQTGPHVSALIERIRQGAVRQVPDEATLALISPDMRDDLTALLDATARHDPPYISLGDFELARPCATVSGAVEVGDADGAVLIGYGFDGDRYVARFGGAHNDVVRIAHDQGDVSDQWYGLEQLLASLADSSDDDSDDD
jgi:hypothetical protein